MRRALTCGALCLLAAVAIPTGGAVAEEVTFTFEPPEGAFYVFADVSAHGRSWAVAQRLLERRRVITVPGAAFGAGGEGFLRISFAASEEEIVEGVRRIRAELEGRP